MDRHSCTHTYIDSISFTSLTAVVTLLQERPTPVSQAKATAGGTAGAVSEQAAPSVQAA